MRLYLRYPLLKMTENLDWKFYTSVADSQYLEISGINIWSLKWNTEYEKIIVKDPLYGALKTFNRYWIKNDNETIEFVAGEFSNCVWGIYLKLDLIEKHERKYGKRTKEKVISDFKEQYSKSDNHKEKFSILELIKNLFRNKKTKGNTV